MCADGIFASTERLNFFHFGAVAGANLCLSSRMIFLAYSDLALCPLSLSSQPVFAYTTELKGNWGLQINEKESREREREREIE